MHRKQLVNRINTMRQNLNQAFKGLSELNPSLKLEEIILHKIELEKDKSLKRKLVFYYAGLIGSAAAVLAAIFIFGKAFLESEFLNVASLAFSDAAVVATHWQEFSYSILETFPVINAIAILIPVFALLLSLNMLTSLNNKNYHRYI